MSRIYKRLPCGCLERIDGDGLVPCEKHLQAMIENRVEDKVIAWIEKMPKGRKLCICNRCYTKDELIEEVEKGTKVGKFIVEIYLEAEKYLKGSVLRNDG